MSARIRRRDRIESLSRSEPLERIVGRLGGSDQQNCTMRHASRIVIGCQVQNAIVSKHWLVAVTLLGMFQVQSPHSSILVPLIQVDPFFLPSCKDHGQTGKGWGPQLVMNAMILLRSKFTLSPGFSVPFHSEPPRLVCPSASSSCFVAEEGDKPKFFTRAPHDLTHCLPTTHFPSLASWSVLRLLGVPTATCRNLVAHKRTDDTIIV